MRWLDKYLAARAYGNVRKDVPEMRHINREYALKCRMLSDDEVLDMEIDRLIRKCGEAIIRQTRPEENQGGIATLNRLRLNLKSIAKMAKEPRRGGKLGLRKRGSV